MNSARHYAVYVYGNTNHNGERLMAFFRRATVVRWHLVNEYTFVDSHIFYMSLSVVQDQHHSTIFLPPLI